MHDESGGTAGVDDGRLPTRRQRALAIAIVSSSIIAAIYGLYLADRFSQCGTGGGSESFGWIMLIVGTCLLAPGVGAAIVSRSLDRGTLRQTVMWVTCLCAIPLVVAWLSWLDRWSGCSG